MTMREFLVSIIEHPREVLRSLWSNELWHDKDDEIIAFLPIYTTGNNPECIYALVFTDKGREAVIQLNRGYLDERNLK